ncbi:MAG: DUF2335 domain-containing protein [Chloroflexi bacterium]|nr:DUF2335 domain-containing protein [Chloroflexota bacterium]
MLEQYNSVLPDAAERILHMAEEQQSHRISLEKTVVGGDSKRAYIGLGAGLTVALTVIVVAGGLIIKGHDWAGVTIAGIDLVSLTAVFVYGTRSRRAEREGKAQSIGQQQRRRR